MIYCTCNFIINMSVKFHFWWKSVSGIDYLQKKSTNCAKTLKYGGRESSTHCNFRKHMQIEKAPANQENIFISLTADSANAHNTNKKRNTLQMLTTQTKKETHCKCSHNQIHFICSAFLFWLCCEHLQRVRCQIDESVFLICRCFFYLQRVELSRPPY